MNIQIPKLSNHLSLPVFREADKSDIKPVEIPQTQVLPVYGDDAIRTKPSQLSLFFMHDFHGHNIRMERAYSAAKQFDNDTLVDDSAFTKKMPVDKIKLASGDMFLGENKTENMVTNEFLNIVGVVANTIGNHECDASIDEFAEIVKNKKYNFLGANLHPLKDSKMNDILSNSIIIEVNGNKYGIIGLSPTDMLSHIKRPEEIEQYNLSNDIGSLKDLQKNVNALREHGINKIILLSHAGLPKEQYIAQHVSDIDIILGAHTHNLLTEIKEGENLFKSPKGEPVLIMQVGRDGQYIGVPNIVFNEYGQIVKAQYNVVKTEDFARSLIAKNAFENIIGKSEIVGKIGYVEDPPEDMYAYENPHGDFIVDCLRSEFNTDIAVVNSANLRGRFYSGPLDTRDLHLITPFGNKMVIIKATEKEIVNSIQNCTRASMADPKHRPGILQVSGLRYEFSASTGDLISLEFVDKNNKVHPIDINNPREDKFYTIALDDFCATVESNGMGLKHRYNEAIAVYDYDKDKYVADYLRKQKKPVKIVSDGRIKTLE